MSRVRIEFVMECVLVCVMECVMESVTESVTDRSTVECGQSGDSVWIACVME